MGNLSKKFRSGSNVHNGGSISDSGTANYHPRNYAKYSKPAYSGKKSPFSFGSSAYKPGTKGHGTGKRKRR